MFVDVMEAARRDSERTGGRGFATLCPAEPSRKQRALVELADDPSALWRRKRHWAKTPDTVDAIGCHFLSDMRVCGPGYVFDQSRDLLVDSSPSSQVARDWISRQPDLGFRDPDLRPSTVSDDPILLLFGPGYGIWGHWLIEFLPRAAIAKELLGREFRNWTILLPADVPGWSFDLLSHFCGVTREQVRYFDNHGSHVIARDLCLPSFAFSGEYNLHSFLRRFYSRFKPPVTGPKRALCVSRVNVDPHGRSTYQVFESRAAFEEIAVSRGYDIILPETLSVEQQISTFAGASVVVGEHGSGVHNAIFSDSGTVVACFPMSNAIQMRIGELCKHKNVYLHRLKVWTDSDGVQRYSASIDDMHSMFEAIDALRSS